MIAPGADGAAVPDAGDTVSHEAVEDADAVKAIEPPPVSIT
jgi:hypothetical protein